MSLNPKILVLLGAIVAAMVFLVARSVGGQEKLYYQTIEEFMVKPNDKPVRLAGFVSEGSIGKDQSGLEVIFRLRDQAGKTVLPVIFDSRKSGGRIPDTFVDGAQVVVTGKLEKDGRFHAHELLAKCPSKYEAASQPSPAGV